MKFIRDIIGDKQIQSGEPPEAAPCGASPDAAWDLPEVDLSEGLTEDRPTGTIPDLQASLMPEPPLMPEPALRQHTAHHPAQHPAQHPERRGAPEASVIRRALWPEENAPEAPAAMPAPTNADAGQPDPFEPSAPRFGRRAYLDALPEDPAEDLTEDLPEDQLWDLPDTPAMTIPDATPTRAGRVKTRLLGFGGDAAFPADPIQRAPRADVDTSAQFPVGWLVVVSGPGRGASFTLQAGVAQIGRGTGQGVRLDFGDTAISRENHAAVAYDPERNAFFIGHGGKANLVRCNDMPVLATQELAPGDRIRVGETTLLFTPLCGPGFAWTEGA